ncbi:MAG TPA: signal peptide peptidase SppA [Caldilineae bacterium]|nr:signal peptide peptidase SppA [Caldilineae bacterium]
MGEISLQSETLRRRWPWVAGIGLAVILLCGLCVIIGLSVVVARQGISTGAAIALIRVEGVILSGSPPSPWVSGAYSERIIKQLERADEDGRVKAIILYINSPGGSVVGSDEIYRALRRVRKPIVAAMGDVAASGGYYIACGADYIYANPNTFTGSIGVVATIPNAAELLDKLGIEAVILRSGPRKAEGNIFEKLSPEAREILQRLIEDAYETFVSVVAEGRGMDEEDVRALADGRVYNGRQALELGLIDALGDLDAAIEKAKELGKIRGEPRIIEYRRPPSLWEALLSGLAQVPRIEHLWPQMLEVPSGPVLEYRYVVP